MAMVAVMREDMDSRVPGGEPWGRGSLGEWEGASGEALVTWEGALLEASPGEGGEASGEEWGEVGDEAGEEGEAGGEGRAIGRQCSTPVCSEQAGES